MSFSHPRAWIRLLSVGVAFVMLACRSGSQSPSPATNSVPRSVSSSASRFVAPRERPVIEPYLDPRDWFVAEPPVKRAAGLSKPIIPGPFPGLPVAYVEAVERGYPEMHTEPFDGCAFISNQGSYCPLVLRSKRRLSDEQKARLMAIVEEPPVKFGTPDNPEASAFESRVHRHEPDSGMAFVFFDARDRVVGVVALTRDCRAWEFAPRIVDRWTGFADLSPEEAAVVATLHEELGLNACTVGRNPYFSEPLEVRAKRLLSLLFRDSPVADGTRPLASTTAEERRRLCLWASRTARIGAYLRFGYDDRTHLYDYAHFGPAQSTVVSELLPVESCIRRFPESCSTTIVSVVEEVRRVVVGISEGRFVQPSPCSFGLVPMPGNLLMDSNVPVHELAAPR